MDSLLPNSGSELDKLLLSMSIFDSKNIKKAAIYERVSRFDERSPGYSLQIQPDEAEKYAKNQGWEIYKVYSDPGRSGKNSKRPQFMEMENDIRAGKVQVVVVHRLDRLFRNLESLLRYVRFLQKYHVQLVSVTEKIETNSWWGKLVMYVLGALAEMIIWQTSERTREAIHVRVSKNKLPAGSYRFGYCKGLCKVCTDPNGDNYCPNFGNDHSEENADGKVLVPHPIESHAVCLMAHLYSQGWSDRDIADHLNRNHFTLPNGQVIQFRTKGTQGKFLPGPFNKDSVRQIITSPFYVGIIPSYPRSPLSMEDRTIE